MKKSIRILAIAVVFAMFMGMGGGALALEIPSSIFRLPSVKVRPEETPAPEQPAEETPADETPTEQPVEEETAEETPVEEEPVEEEPAEETPVEEQPTEETPTEEAPAEEQPVADDTAYADIDVSQLKVEITTTQGDVVIMGETITLSSVLTGFDGLTYALQWQCDNGSGWQDVEGATGESYSFTADENNINFQWRLSVTL